MPRAALSPDAVVALALRLVDEEGPDALTLSAVAGRAGVATPSLYKHVRGLAELRGLVSGRVLAELTEIAAEAALGRSGDDALRALMDGWRAYAARHPHRYSVLVQAPLPETAEAGERLVGVLLAALRAYGLEGSAAIHAVRCLRAVTHGFAVLEAEGAFRLAEDLDESYALLAHMVVSGLRTARETSITSTEPSER
ncbi:MULTISPECIES: TetR/AcrR family transcriptional regulator [unclassified Microbispora]|uniref:TetR/AcrR family transcriptional regulator n=1 Tax=unclassified Microbispora TaxID=2614687 RepID=UPI0016030509|nr:MULTISPECIES: TetR/AcrR family transcriptional regulator [unclassified Microbispora]